MPGSRFIQVLVLFLVLVATVRASPRCEDLPATSVNVVLLESELRTNFQHGYRALKGMSQRYADHGFHVLGLTVGQATVKAKASLRSLREPGGRWECSTAGLTFEIGYQPLTVYVGREFSPESCGFREIYQHELRHAEIYRRQARQAAAELTQALTARFAGMGPWRGPVGSGQSKIESEINERWLPYARRLLEQAEPLQREVDSREEYERVAQSCDGQIARVLRQAASRH